MWRSGVPALRSELDLAGQVYTKTRTRAGTLWTRLFVSSRRRHTRLTVTGVQTCALPISEIQELAGGLREYYKPAWKSSSSRKSSLRPPVTVALWHSNKSSNLSQGITLLVWFTASIAPRDIRRRQVARSTGQSKSSSEFRRHGRLARLLPAQRMGRRLRLQIGRASCRERG